MIVSSSSQTSFVDDLFKEEPFKRSFIHFVGNTLPTLNPPDI
jgi:hypothetical protein